MPSELTPLNDGETPVLLLLNEVEERVIIARERMGAVDVLPAAEARSEDTAT